MIATASIASCAVLFGDPNTSFAEVGGPGYSSSEEGIVRLKPCDAKSNCVSSNYLEPPNRYMSPLKIVNDRDVAFQRAVRELQNQGNSKSSGNFDSALNGFTIMEIVPKEYYIHIATPGKTPGSIYDVELVFPPDSGIVNVRCQARVALPPPPFCVKKNCINGNMDQRQTVEDLMYGVLGLPPADQKQMQEGAKWTPIFFNSDRVPGFDEYV